MKGSSEVNTQRELFRPMLVDFIDMKHELVLLSNKIDWKHLDQELSKYYSSMGRPSMPVRLMVGCLFLKRLYNLGDETLAKEWKMNPYMQYFCGYSHFQHQFPFDPSDLVHFRKRIGEEGAKKIFAYSVKIHGKDAQEKQALSDTTVQGNYTTFPTDAKLAKRVIDKLNALAQLRGVKQRQSYVRTSKQLLRDSYNSKHPSRVKKAKKAIDKLRIIAGRLIRELERKLTPEQWVFHEEELALYQQILNQKRTDRNKIYSVHKPFTSCIAKGKAHKPYEFGNKVGLTVTSKTLIVTSIKAFEGNPHDSKTIEPLIRQMEQNDLPVPKEIVYDRAGKGQKQIGETLISTPDNRPLKRASAYQKRKKRKKFRRRAVIEAVIGHLKSDCRMEQNYLHGVESPQINAFLAAVGWNMRKMMEKLSKQVYFLFSFERSYLKDQLLPNLLFVTR